MSERAGAGDSVFGPISGPRAFAEVIDQLTFAIRSGRFTPGSRLPNIEELARLMKVSRPTVGEALRLLADARVVETRRGVAGGVVVTSWIVPHRLLRLSSRVGDSTLEQLLEARRPVEMELAVLAARRALPEDLEQMRRAIDLQRLAVNDPKEWFQTNNYFHYSLGRAARSPVLAHMQHDLIGEMEVLLGGRSLAHVTGAQHVIDAHEMTLAAIAGGDVEEVRHVMEEHLGPMERNAEELDQLSHRQSTKAVSREA